MVLSYDFTIIPHPSVNIKKANGIQICKSIPYPSLIKIETICENNTFTNEMVVDYFNENELKSDDNINADNKMDFNKCHNNQKFITCHIKKSNYSFIIFEICYPKCIQYKKHKFKILDSTNSIVYMNQFRLRRTRFKIHKNTTKKSRMESNVR